MGIFKISFLTEMFVAASDIVSVSKCVPLSRLNPSASINILASIKSPFLGNHDSCVLFSSVPSQHDFVIIRWSNDQNEDVSETSDDLDAMNPKESNLDSLGMVFSFVVCIIGVVISVNLWWDRISSLVESFIKDTLGFPSWGNCKDRWSSVGIETRVACEKWVWMHRRSVVLPLELFPVWRHMPSERIRRCFKGIGVNICQVLTSWYPTATEDLRLISLSFLIW